MGENFPVSGPVSAHGRRDPPGAPPDSGAKSGNRSGLGRAHAVAEAKGHAMIRTGAFAAMIALAGPALAVPAFFHDAVPFWIAGLPLLAGILAGTRLARAAAMAGWLAVPAAVSAIGLTGIGHAVELVWPGAVLAVLALALLAAIAGIAVATAVVTLVPVFPASPMIVLADTLPGAGILGLGIVALVVAVIEALGRGRGLLLVGLVAFLGAWKGHAPPPPASDWAGFPEPPGVTERGRWIAVRDFLPDGAAAVLGEAVFRADDLSARDFWCRAAEARDLTLFIGVTETWNRADRGAVWRLDRESCAPGAAPAVAVRAWLGIPGVTGGWLPMPGGGTVPEFLVCLEAFLPWSWARLETAGSSSDVVVVSNDGAFGSVPVPVLRRKAAGAMAALLGVGIAHAVTGRTLLLRTQGRFEE